ncbi:MAG: ornithine cyclodeaminase family protein [Desulfobacteraceae bacterium]|nr:ornithine cyclodeaminase family protein [Desulfobacteraceae bacterium]
MLFISKKDIGKISQEIIQNAVKKAYELVLNNSYNMPDRIHVGDEQNTLLLMPCFSKEFFATKLVSVFPDAVKYNQPAVNGVLVLADNKTGQPLCLMDGAAVTAERTGAVGGLGVDLLTPENLEIAGILGAGVQGLSQARYILFNRRISKLWIGDLNLKAADKMARILEKEFPQVTYVTTDNSEELVTASQLIIAATTSSRPLFRDDPGLVKGKIFISIGSFKPDMKEFPDAVISNADHVYVDTLFAAKESGDICIPLEKKVVELEKIKTFSSLLAKPVCLENKTCFFKSVGMALFDLTVASAVYKLALKEKMGQKLEF